MLREELAEEPCVHRKQPTPNGKKDRPKMRGVLLWLIGIPIPIIILLYLFNVI